MRTVPILFTFDDKLLIPAGVCITSLLMNAYPDTFYDIFILHSDKLDFSNSDLVKIEEQFKNCRITFRRVSNEFVGSYEVRGIPETAYYRLLAPELIPEYDKILYSDVDVIFRDDLSRFYYIDLQNNYFAAVDNGGRWRPEVQEYMKKELNLDWKKGCFYSGNLVINSSQIIKDQITDRFRELGTKQFNQQDMDIMNIVCYGRIMNLGPEFCLTNYLYGMIVNRRQELLEVYSQEQLDRALKTGIVHYNGAKPWKSACMNMDIWWEYYRKSIFFDEEFAFKFWDSQSYLLERLSLNKRIKLVIRKLLGRD